QQAAWRDLRSQLAAENIVLVGDGKLPAAQSRWLAEYFECNILPVITPQAIDPAHPFPFIANQGMGLMLALTRQADQAPVLEMVLIPQALPRFIRLPGEQACWIAIED